MIDKNSKKVCMTDWEWQKAKRDDKCELLDGTRYFKGFPVETVREKV